ncbi:DUF4258 domain-containing protein [uncultured Brevibacterium sp.]|uniref:DUF4258 domain-containing protein n=1 Tax=uncultured Brevibacterium sp. TaxID=189678 RepID=UPI0034531373
MLLKITNHAKSRMRTRRVTEDDIEYVLSRKCNKTETPKDSFKFEGKAQDGRTLKIWCPKDSAGPGIFTVKSVAWKEER